jgi:exonuclease III
VVSWNAAGLRGKISELQLWLLDNKVDVVAIQEAQFAAKRTVRLNGFQDPVFAKRRRGRMNGARWSSGQGRRCGNLRPLGLIFQRLCEAPLHVDDEVTEWCCVKVFGAESASVDVHCIYRPPVRTGTGDERVDRFDVSCLRSDPGVLLCGDVNAHHPRWDGAVVDADEVGERLAAWMDEKNWVALNSKAATRHSYGTAALGRLRT